MHEQLQHAVAAHQTTEQGMNSLCLEDRLVQGGNAMFVLLLSHFASKLFVEKH